MYDHGWEMLVWDICYGICWAGIGVCAPWQATRNMMVKNENNMILASVFVIVACFLLNYAVQAAAVFFHFFDIGSIDPTTIYLWAAHNILPTIVGIVLLTGIVAAGISSATTFLSLLGNSLCNDFLRIDDTKKSIRVSRISMVVFSLIAFFFAYNAGVNIWWINQISANVISASWLPLAIASVWSKRVTKAGAISGMCSGFGVAFVLKLISTGLRITLPIYADPFIAGILANILVMVIVSRCTSVTPEELAYREKLFLIPGEEKTASAIRISCGSAKAVIAVGFVIIAVLLFTWALPYYRGLGVL